MAKKKIEPITSLGSEDKLTVQKSLPLFSLWRSELTLSEFKILDTYLSRIDSHKPEKRLVVFEKGELESLLGVKKINKPELEERLKHLMGNVVKIPDIDEKKGFRLITLFEEAVAEQDDYGLWQIKLECTQKAMKYIFNIENLGYLRYKLRCITAITSRYTYIMFVYLEANRFRKTWEVPLDELKEILSCDKEETYKEFKRFNDLILKKVQAELTEKTECRYTYEPIKKGRRVTGVQFKIKTRDKTFENTDTELQAPPSEDLNAPLWYSAVEEFNFDEKQLDVIAQCLSLVPDRILPKFDEESRNTEEFKRYSYLAVKVAEINQRDSIRPIKNKFAYLSKIIKKDVTSKPENENQPEKTSSLDIAEIEKLAMKKYCD